MKNNSMNPPTETVEIVMSPEDVLKHWQGHRNLTRRTIEAFPEDKLFEFSVGGMRPFSDLAVEIIQMAGPGLVGIVTRQWKSFDDSAPKKPTTKKELLELWDKTTDVINENWSKIPEGRFQETDLAFGQWEGPIHWLLYYLIDNEIHHRAQGYVYLRALGIQPPHFWER